MIDYRADDRSQNEPDEPGTPSREALLALWDERDAAYRAAGWKLKPEQIAVVRAVRAQEAIEAGAAALVTVAMNWEPRR